MSSGGYFVGDFYVAVDFDAEADLVQWIVEYSGETLAKDIDEPGVALMSILRTMARKSEALKRDRQPDTIKPEETYDEPLGDDGYPLDMDDETKSWLRGNYP